MEFMVAAYLVIWLAAFAFIFNMVRRQGSLQREIDALKEQLRDKESRRPL